MRAHEASEEKCMLFNHRGGKPRVWEVRVCAFLVPNRPSDCLRRHEHAIALPCHCSPCLTLQL